MSTRILLLFVVMMMISANVHADIIILKDGRAINAPIISQDDEKMKIEENGQKVTYYKDQIQSVNGKPLTPVEQAVEIEGKVEKTTDAVQTAPQPTGMSKRALIKKFIDVFGTRENMTQNFDRMVSTLPPDKAQEIKKILNVDEVIDNIMPLYDKYFTQEDLEAYIAFYSSESGQKFLKAIPQIMKESVDVNIEYFKTKMPAGS